MNSDRDTRKHTIRAQINNKIKLKTISQHSSPTQNLNNKSNSAQEIKQLPKDQFINYQKDQKY